MDAFSQALASGELALWTPLVLMLAGVGVVAGFLAGLLGVGGGIVLVPGIYYTLTTLGFPHDATMHMAVGTSLAVIIPTGFTSSRAHWKRGAVDIELVRRIGVGTLIGVGAGTLIAGHVSGADLKAIFACALFLIGLILLGAPSRYTIAQNVPRQPWAAMAGFFIGGLSSLMGIGGATVSVPFMTSCRVPIHRAVGTASALGVAISIPAALGFVLIGWGIAGRPPFSLGYISIPAWAVIVPLSVLTAPLGVNLAHRLHVKHLRRVFAVFVIVISMRMLAGVINGS